MLENMWVGTMGAVALTFVIFYATLRYTGLQKYRQLINSSLMLWYHKKFFYISGIISLVLLGSILGFIDYGHTHYSDRLMVICSSTSRKSNSRLKCCRLLSRCAQPDGKSEKVLDCRDNRDDTCKR
jgi:hypothetical protein